MCGTCGMRKARDAECAPTAHACPRGAGGEGFFRERKVKSRRCRHEAGHGPALDALRLDAPGKCPFSADFNQSQKRPGAGPPPPPVVMNRFLAVFPQDAPARCDPRLG